MFNAEPPQPQPEIGTQLPPVGDQNELSSVRSKLNGCWRPPLWSTGKVLCTFRFPKLTTSGPPSKELQGGVPVAICATAEDRTTTRKNARGRMRRRLIIGIVSSRLPGSPQKKRGSGLY